MTDHPAHDTMLGARVTLELRHDYEELARRRDLPDLSPLIRAALRRYADEELGRIAHPPAPPRIFDPRPGAARGSDPSTSKAAAALVRPRTGTQRRRILELYYANREPGLTADECVAFLELEARQRGTAPPAVNGVAKRVSELAQAHAIEPAVIIGPVGGAGDVLTRPTRHGVEATVYRITELGTAWLRPTPDRKAA